MPNFNGLWTSRQQMQARGGNVWPSVPGAPTSPVASPLSQSASVAFVAPADTGFPAGITGYRVTSTPGGFTGTGLTSPVVVSGLTNGTAYTFTVAAQNVNGYGPESVASNSVTPVLPNYIEEVFSTTLYVGNGSTQVLTTGIDTSTKGGLVWLKGRNIANNHALFDTVRGTTKRLTTDTTAAQITAADELTSFNVDGCTLGAGSLVNRSNFGFTSWTFREQPKFFDVVTYSGNSGTQNIAHNLGSVPGCIIVKFVSGSAGVGNWPTWHRGLSSGNIINLNLTGGQGGPFPTYFGNNTITVDPTSTQFTVGSNANVNESGSNYVAYIFAHDAGGFGLSGSDNVISCGSYTCVAYPGDVTVTLGYEPQWVMVKNITQASNWVIYDTMRSMPGTSVVTALTLAPDSAAGENGVTGSAPGISPTSNGFIARAGLTAVSGSAGDKIIYVAVRRGPMAVPTLGTTVFEPATTANGTLSSSVPVKDTVLNFTLASTAGWQIVDRLRGIVAGFTSNTVGNTTTNAYLVTNTTAAESSSNSRVGGLGIARGIATEGTWYNGDTTVIATGAFDTAYFFQRAPSFYDTVCYTGTGVTRTVTHNLGVAPELMIIKSRSAATDWRIYSAAIGAGSSGTIDTGSFSANGALYWNSTAPTSTVFTLGSGGNINTNAATFVAYLFATCAGVSKVGSYTGTGATQTIACGFAAGARWVMIKRTDSTGDWYVWDSVRGMVAGTNPSLLLNSSAAQVNANSIYTITTGFQIVSTAAGINASGGTYIFLAIA